MEKNVNDVITHALGSGTDDEIVTVDFSRIYSGYRNQLKEPLKIPGDNAIAHREIQSKTAKFLFKATESTTARILRTSTIPAERHTSPYEGLEISVTTAVFTVVLITIAAFLLLCCCKAYLLICCKRRNILSRRQSEEVNNCSRRSFHQHLPVRCRHSDEPPCYDDVLSGRILTLNAAGYRETMANPVKLRTEEVSIFVKWSHEDDANDPPLYSTVTDGMRESACDDTPPPPPPPSYYATPMTPYCGQTAPSSSTSDVATNSRKRIAIVKKTFNNALQTVSGFVFPQKFYPETNGDQASEITCDGNVMREISSSRTRETEP